MSFWFRPADRNSAKPFFTSPVPAAHVLRLKCETVAVTQPPLLTLDITHALTHLPSPHVYLHMQAAASSLLARYGAMQVGKMGCTM